MASSPSSESREAVTSVHHVPEGVRSRAWATAKPAALNAWASGSADTTQMLMALRAGTDAIFETCYVAPLEYGECHCGNPTRLGMVHLDKAEFVDECFSPVEIQGCERRD